MNGFNQPQQVGDREGRDIPIAWIDLPVCFGIQVVKHLFRRVFGKS